MKTLAEHRIEAIAQIERTGLVPHNMRACLEDDRLVIFGSCRDGADTVVQEGATCQDLNDGQIRIIDMVSRIRAKIEASGASVPGG
jgi:hypothetical protein